MWARTAFVEARLWTWEVVTGFDGVLDPVTLRYVSPRISRVLRNCVQKALARRNPCSGKW